MKVFLEPVITGVPETEDENVTVADAAPDFECVGGGVVLRDGVGFVGVRVPSIVRVSVAVISEDGDSDPVSTFDGVRVSNSPGVLVRISDREDVLDAVSVAISEMESDALLVRSSDSDIVSDTEVVRLPVAVPDHERVSSSVGLSLSDDVFDMARVSVDGCDRVAAVSETVSERVFSGDSDMLVVMTGVRDLEAVWSAVGDSESLCVMVTSSVRVSELPYRVRDSEAVCSSDADRDVVGDSESVTGGETVSDSVPVSTVLVASGVSDGESEMTAVPVTDPVRDTEPVRDAVSSIVSEADGETVADGVCDSVTGMLGVTRWDTVTLSERVSDADPLFDRVESADSDQVVVSDAESVVVGVVELVGVGSDGEPDIVAVSSCVKDTVSVSDGESVAVAVASFDGLLVMGSSCDEVTVCDGVPEAVGSSVIEALSDTVLVTVPDSEPDRVAVGSSDKLAVPLMVMEPESDTVKTSLFVVVASVEDTDGERVAVGSSLGDGKVKLCDSEGLGRVTDTLRVAVSSSVKDTLDDGEPFVRDGCDCDKDGESLMVCGAVPVSLTEPWVSDGCEPVPVGVTDPDCDLNDAVLSSDSLNVELGSDRDGDIDAVLSGVSDDVFDPYA